MAKRSGHNIHYKVPESGFKHTLWATDIAQYMRVHTLYIKVQNKIE